MGAIWGIVDFSDEYVDECLFHEASQIFGKYKVDRISSCSLGNAYFGAAYQDITNCYDYEKGPIADGHIILTTDCMIDNRDELISILEISEIEISDTRIMYESYKKWGTDFTNYVIGIYSVVIYNKDVNSCELITDHMGNRALYYSIKDDKLVFSTLFEPILILFPGLTLEYKWLAASAAIVSPDMEVFDGLTPYKDVFQLYAATIMEVDAKKCQKNRYWDPTRNSEDYTITYKEHNNRYFEALEAAVTRLMNNNLKIGMTLSGGLDSSSIAALAATELKKTNRNLYSYTSIPLKEYKSHVDRYFVVDESDDVKELCKKYNNIIPTFNRADNRNALNVMSEVMDFLEIPYKAVHNAVWLSDIYQKATEDGVRIILKGQYGNATISYGKVLTRLYNDLMRVAPGEAFEELRVFCLKNRISRKKVLKALISETFKKIRPLKQCVDDSLLKQSIDKKYNIFRTINKNWKATGGTYLDTRKQRLEFLFSPRGLAQLAAYDTRFGLKYGMIIRDPTKDKRLVELTSFMPMKCFVNGGYERAFVRENMRGLIPDKIRLNMNRRGRQSADFSFRLLSDWERSKMIIMDLLCRPWLLDLIDERKLDVLKSEIDELSNYENEKVDYILSQALMICSLSMFLDQTRRE